MHIAHFLDFEFKTITLGNLRICALESELNKAIRKEVREDEVDSKELTSRIFLNVAHKLTGDSSLDGICGGAAVEDSEVPRLTDDELDNFAEKYGARFFGQQDGRGPTDGEPGGTGFLVHQIKKSMRLDTEHHAKVLEQAQKIYSSTTLDAISRNEEVSIRLSGALRDYATPVPQQSYDAFRVLPNPVRETTEALVKLLEKVERMQPVFAMCAELIQSMNSTALQMQSDSTAAATRADTVSAKSMRVATIGIYIALVTLGISCFFSIWTIVDARKSSHDADLQTSALRKDIRDSTAAANQARRDLESAAAEDRRALIAAVSKMVPADNHSQSKSTK